MNIYVVFLICILGGYLVGCLNFGLIVSKLKYKTDIREHGSGNAGATNTFRVFGKAAGVVVLILDMAKSFVFLTVISHKLGLSVFMLYLAGLSVVIGHIYPAFFGFKGGKGVSATGGTIAALCPFAFIPLAIVFILTILIKKKVGLGSVVAVSMIPFGVLLVNLIRGMTWPLMLGIFAVTLIMSAIVVSRHKENIIQMKKDGII
ncbi:MAG: glycerol-3-phosphate 1-O-acyltransferase PlsY [Ruminococcaceae bacterium]|nr:glycerol-3-phosphate 1-O-acyltransferase PlsY [Oscillospiraceae bacterium]